MKRAGFLFVVLVLGAALAAGQTADPDAVLAEIVRLRHARENLEQLPALMQAGAEQSLKQMPPALAEKLRPVLRQGIPEAYKPELLFRGVLNHMKRNYDPERATALLKALRSPLLQKISTLNSQASTPESMKKMEEYAATLAATPPRPERVALLKELDEVGGDAEWAITLNLEMVRAQHRAFERFPRRVHA